jgi:hypothetical protein
VFTGSDLIDVNAAVCVTREESAAAASRNDPRGELTLLVAIENCCHMRETSRKIAFSR